MSRIGNMCIWEVVVEVGTYCLLSTLGLYVMLILLAMLVDVVWVCEIHECYESNII